MKKTSPGSPTSANKNDKQQQNKSALLQNNGKFSSARSTTVRKSQISRPSVIVQKQRSSYFKKLEQSEHGSSGSLSAKEAEQLTRKFEALSRSIVDLARRQSPLGVRSLESLLTREISETLGPALNHPKFSQGFIQATRTLLDSLVSDFESGKVNPSLIRPDGNHILKADSSTTLCYRDKYFKELVVSMLQSLCCEDTDAETDKKSVQSLSAESQERIQAIRNRVQAELGIDPQVFTELDLKVAELRKSMLKSGTDAERNSKEIAEHLDYLKIPRSARDALRISCGGQSSPTEVKRDTLRKIDESLSRIDLGTGYSTKSLFNFKNSSLMNTNDDKESPVATTISDMERIIDPLDSYSRIFDIESALDEDDDEISQEETRTFLEAFAADMLERKRTGAISDKNKVLESVNSNVISKSNVLSNISCSTVFLEEPNIDDLADRQTRNIGDPITHYQNIDDTKLCSPCLSNLEDVVGNVGHCNIVKRKVQAVEITDSISNITMINKVKSHFLLREVNTADKIIKEMQIEFDKFKELTREAFEELKAAASESQSKEHLSNDKTIEDISKYLVNDFVIILKNISERVYLLPIIFDDRNLRFTERQKQRAFRIIDVLEKCFQINYHSMAADYEPSNNTKQLTRSVKSVLLAFTNLAKIIHHLPSKIKNMPISVLDPPQTLMETLAVLISAEYFQDCFPPKESHKQQHNDEDDDFKFDLAKSLKNELKIKWSKPGAPDLIKGAIHNIQSPSETNPNDITAGQQKRTDWFVNRSSNKADNCLNLGIGIGYSSSNITIKNLSDMFLHISTLLNDVPEDLKTKKFITLNPRYSLRQAVRILYSSDDEEFLKQFEKKKSFNSLTIQNTSDLFLTLSKTFHDVPERLKNLVVKDLDPPRSLSKAISLLTSLSISSIQECLTEENHMITEKNESQENFFDSVEVLSR